MISVPAVRGLCLFALLCSSAAIGQIIPGTPSTLNATPATTTGTSTDPRRDQAALLALAKMQGAMAWPLDGSLKDLILKAALTVTPISGAPHTDQITIKARCSDQRLVIENETTGSVTIKLDEMAIYHQGSDLRSVPWLSLQPFFGSFIPCLLPYFHSAEMQREVVYEGDAIVSGTAVSKISTQQIDKDPGARADLRRRASKMTVALSKDTFLPLEAEIEMTLQNYTARIPTKITFSNYQSDGGVSMPFQIDVSPKRQATFKITLQSIRWNPGLSENDLSPR